MNKQKIEGDKYKAVWVSYSSMGDFLKCPKLYYLHNIKRNPLTGNKVTIANPFMSLGSIVHEVVEGLSKKKAEDRADVQIIKQYEKEWSKVSGRKGGFLDQKEELIFYERGIKMLEGLNQNMGPLLNKTVKLTGGKNNTLPHYWLSVEDEIILCGKIDWLWYIPEDDSVRIIDFKTGMKEEKEDSLQLPIYMLLLKNLQKRKVSGAYYWYLNSNTGLKEVSLPGVDESFKKVYDLAFKIKKTRQNNLFNCPNGDKGCFACQPYEKIFNGEAEYVGVGEYNHDVFVVRDDS